MRFFTISTLACLAAFATIACSSAEAPSGSTSSSTSSGSGGSGGAPFMEAAHAAFPAVVDHGGAILAHPHVITITFAGYPLQQQVQAFGAWIPTADWLDAGGADYGVSKGAHVTDVILPDAPPAKTTLEETMALLEARITDGTLPDPTGIEDPLYMIYFPHETDVWDFADEQSCGGREDGGGYHWEGAHAGTKYAFAVLPTCSSDPVKSITYVEESAGHELIEAATDPFPLTEEAWVIGNFDSPWTAINGEVGDLCQFMSWNTYGDFTVPRVWSNSAAMANQDPCVPAPQRPFQEVTSNPNVIKMVPAGQSIDFELTGWSTEAVAPWKLETVPWGQFMPTITLEKDTIQNGETVKLTFTVPADAPSGAQGNALVYSVRDLNGGDYAYWPVVVRVP